MTIRIDNIGLGDVVGPSSSTDNALARFDGTTGKILQNSVVTVDDLGNLTTTGSLISAKLDAPAFLGDGAVQGTTTYDFGATDVPIGVYGEVYNTGDVSSLGGHGIGLLGLARDTADGTFDLYGLEGRVNALGSGGTPFGVLGLSTWEGADYSGRLAIGVEGRVELTSDGSTPIGTGTSIAFYAPSIIGGDSKFSFFGKDPMRVDNTLYVYEQGPSPSYNATLLHDGTNAYLSANFGAIVLTPATNSFVITGTGTEALLPLENSAQNLGYPSFNWLAVYTDHVYSDSGTVDFGDDHITTTGKGTFGTTYTCEIGDTTSDYSIEANGVISGLRGYFGAGETESVYLNSGGYAINATGVSQFTTTAGTVVLGYGSTGGYMSLFQSADVGQALNVRDYTEVYGILAGHNDGAGGVYSLYAYGNGSVYLNDGTYAINALGTSYFTNGSNTVTLTNSSYAIDVIGTTWLENGSGGDNALIISSNPSTAGLYMFDDYSSPTRQVVLGDPNNYIGLGSGAGNFWDDQSNSVSLADGTYAINATGSAYITSEGGLLDATLRVISTGGADDAILATSYSTALGGDFLAAIAAAYGGAAGYFQDPNYNSVYLGDGTYAINATGQNYFTDGSIWIVSMFDSSAFYIDVSGYGSISIGHGDFSWSSSYNSMTSQFNSPYMGAGYFESGSNWVCMADPMGSYFALDAHSSSYQVTLCDENNGYALNVISGYSYFASTVGIGLATSPSAYLGVYDGNATAYLCDGSGAAGYFDYNGGQFSAFVCSSAGALWAYDSSGNGAYIGDGTYAINATGYLNLSTDSSTPSNGSNDPNVVTYQEFYQNGTKYWVALYQ